MFYIIETKRLTLREVQHTDDVAMFELDADADVHRYLGGKPAKTIEESRIIIDNIKNQYRCNGVGRWAVVEKISGKFIGWAGLRLERDTINGHSNFYDLGYRLIKRYWGNGYATEAASLAVRYAWDVLRTDELFAYVHIDNIASRKVLEHVGMQHTGTFDYDGMPHAWYSISNPTNSGNKITG